MFVINDLIQAFNASDLTIIDGERVASFYEDEGIDEPETTHLVCIGENGGEWWVPLRKSHTIDANGSTVTKDVAEGTNLLITFSHVAPLTLAHINEAAHEPAPSTPVGLLRVWGGR